MADEKGHITHLFQTEEDAARIRDMLLKRTFTQDQAEIRAEDLMANAEFFKNTYPDAYQACAALAEGMRDGSIDSFLQLEAAMRTSITKLPNPEHGFVLEEAVSTAINKMLKYARNQGYLPTPNDGDKGRR